MTRTSHGFIDYEQGVTPPPAPRRKAKPQDTGADDLFAGVVPAARLSDPPTSNDGIADVLPRAGSQQYKLLLAYGSRPMGLTADEAGEIAGLTHTGWWKRISELHRDGLITDTFTTRLASTGSAQRVLSITEKGRRAIK